MSMIGVSVASSKSLQLEATQEAYNKAVVKLNLLLIDDKRTKKWSEASYLKSWMKEISLANTPLLICMSCKKALRKRLMIFLLD